MGDDNDRMTGSRSTEIRGTDARANLTPASKRPGKVKEIDEMLAAVQASFGALTPHMKNTEIIGEALRLHAKLRLVGPKEKSAIAETLLKMYNILDLRIKNAPRDREYFPLLEGIRWNKNDPLSQMGAIEAINPFGWVEYWKTLVIKQVTRVSDKQPQIIRRPNYEKNLKAGVEKLSGVAFGRAELNEKLRGKYWKVEDDPEFGKRLSLTKDFEKAGYTTYAISPAEAIDRMFGKGKFSKNREQWTFDCAQWIQVAFLYALRYTLGKRAFNLRIGRDFHLREQWSSGIKILILWKRDKPGGQIRKYEYFNNLLKNAIVETENTMDKILSLAPIGSRVSWTYPQYDINNINRNQNTIKLGKNKFGSHYPSSFGNVYTRQFFERNSGTKDDEKKPFLSRIEIYDTP